jgi:hypothetical protein
MLNQENTILKNELNEARGSVEGVVTVNNEILGGRKRKTSKRKNRKSKRKSSKRH